MPPVFCQRWIFLKPRIYSLFCKLKLYPIRGQITFTQLHISSFWSWFVIHVKIASGCLTAIVSNTGISKKSWTFKPFHSLSLEHDVWQKNRKQTKRQRSFGIKIDKKQNFHTQEKEKGWLCCFVLSLRFLSISNLPGSGTVIRRSTTPKGYSGSCLIRIHNCTGFEQDWRVCLPHD